MQTKCRFWIGYAIFCLAGLFPGWVDAMGLRSLVALPVDKGGGVLRLMFESSDETGRDNLITSAAYGLSADQTLILGLPYRVSPAGSDRTGDLSVIYRHIGYREDYMAGTDRLGLLLGAVLPSRSEADSAILVGAVFTRFRQRNEYDANLLYRAGEGRQPDSARYDLSWQYRWLPEIRPSWGLPPEWHSVLELNGRWQEDEDLVHQITLGIQWIHPRVVLEGGFVQEISHGNDSLILLSTRLHF